MTASIVGGAALLGARSAAAQMRLDPRASVPYVTVAGDTLYDVAQRYLTDEKSWRALASINHVSAPRRLPAGMTLRLPRSLLRRDATPAKIVAVSGRVTRDLRGAEQGAPGLHALPLSPDGLLSETDEVSTGEDGFATLELDDGSYVSLAPNSRIVLSSLRKTVLTGIEDHVIELQRGELSNEVTHAKQGDDRFEVRTPSIVAGVRGTRFRVSETPSMAAVEVLDGTVAVDNAGKASDGAIARPSASTQFVGAGEGSATPNQRAVGAPQPLLPAPRLVDPGKIQDGKKVTFDLERAQGARGYRVEIARDADSLDLIRDVRVQAPSAAFSDVPDGTYFVRVSAIDADGLQGVPRVYAFERRANELSARASGAGSHAYRFIWHASRLDPQTRFRLVLSHHRDLREPIVDAVDLGESSLVVSDLPAGEYFWRVVSEQYDRGRFYETVGPVHAFTLAR